MSVQQYIDHHIFTVIVLGRNFFDLTPFCTSVESLVLGITPLCCVLHIYNAVYTTPHCGAMGCPPALPNLSNNTFIDTYLVTIFACVECGEIVAALSV